MKTTIKKTRRVFGRIKGIEVIGFNRTLVFEMVKDTKSNGDTRRGGVRVREKGCRKAALVDFEHLVFGGSFVFVCNGNNFTAVLKEGGVEIRRVGDKYKRLVPWLELVRSSELQPALFMEMAGAL